MIVIWIGETLDRGMIYDIGGWKDGEENTEPIQNYVWPYSKFSRAKRKTIKLLLLFFLKKIFY